MNIILSYTDAHTQTNPLSFSQVCVLLESSWVGVNLNNVFKETLWLNSDLKNNRNQLAFHKRAASEPAN